MKNTLVITILFFAFSSMLFGQEGYQKASSIEGLRVIESRAFNDFFLRMDSRGFSEGSKGGGTVNVMNRVGTHEVFKITQQPDSTYTIASTAFKNRYLRMDGGQINKNSKAPGGVVNLQSRIGSYEKFRIERLSDGSYSIESVAFPGRYLTLNPNPNPKNWSQGGGRVQVQNRAGSHERFNLLEKR